ncbi:LOW QUALITY PROTEIN: hypothetical protein BRADI_2g50961v3 [Brachypodium distachyon]|uniref:Apple domain-containing protein n=1 Tax=Brachypodium distachyon TaxID=15368 RepID=A0A2K2DF51_BRADI|nr:LOW QUALITY PROTEIN: hypothetical protein BRADI_2g50961v3 [Brachypodium distachyon]
MDASGITMLDSSGRPMARNLPAVEKSGAGLQAVRFFELGDNGNLGLYFFDQGLNGFSTTYKALGFCELPLTPEGVYSSSGTCDDFSLYGIHLPRPPPLTCNMTSSYDMVELTGVTTVLKADSPLTNVTMQQCVDWCLQGCSCTVALHVRDDGASIMNDMAGGVCNQYGLTAGVREVIGGSARSSYWVKVVKRSTYYARGSWAGETAARARRARRSRSRRRLG